MFFYIRCSSERRVTYTNISQIITVILRLAIWNPRIPEEKKFPPTPRPTMLNYTK